VLALTAATAEPSQRFIGMPCPQVRSTPRAGPPRRYKPLMEIGQTRNMEFLIVDGLPRS